MQHGCLLLPEAFTISAKLAIFKPTAENDDKPCNTDSVLTEWQAGRQAPTSFFYCLPLVTPSLKIAVLFTRNCYQRRGQKNDHMPRAADLCFLYLCVSQNTALYRDTEKRPRQASSRTGGFVFRRAHKGRTHSVFLVKMRRDALLYTSPLPADNAALFPPLMHVLFTCHADR